MNKQIKILLIEDNPGDVRLIEEMLSETVRIQTDFQSADRLSTGMQKLSKNSFDVLLLDLDLPDSVGLASFEKIKQNFPHLPVVIMTGLDDEETGTKSVGMGAQDYIIKGSIGPQSLERIIRYAIERKQSEAELNSNLSFLGTLIQTIPNPMFYKDINGTYRRCNDAFAEKILGQPLKSVLGHTLHDFQDKIPAYQLDIYNQKDMDLLTTGGIQFYEDRVQCADGKFRDYIFNKAVYRDATGAIVGIVGIMLDISQRKKYEDRLELTNQILKHLNQFKNIKDTIREILFLIKGSFGIDAVGIRIKQGDDYPYYETIGFPENFIRTEKYLRATDENGTMLRDENENPILECMCGSVINGRIDASLPFYTKFGSFWTNSTSNLTPSVIEKNRQSYMRNRCHSEGYASVALIPLRAGSETIGLLQINHKQKNLFTLDIIEFFESISASIGITLDRMRSETAIKKSEARFRDLIKNNADAILVIDPGGVVRYVNFAAMVLFNRPKSGLLGKNFGFPLNVNANTEIEIIADDHQIKIGDMRVVETDWNNEKVFLATIRDITEQKNSEQEKKELETRLQQAQKMESIGTLAGGIAHDFNNILSAIIGFSELAMDRAAKDSDLQDDLSEILNAGTRAKDLVKQILTFSRQTDHELKPLRADVIIKEVAQLMRSTLPSTIRIQKTVKTSGEIMADPTQIHQVLMNLCTNAYHAMRSTGGVLNIGLHSVSFNTDDLLPSSEMIPGDYTKITISDTGTGIAPEILPRIFDPYFTTKAKGEGTGLGMAVAHGVIKGHNGHILVESEVGRGTTFIIYLPAIKRKRNIPVAEIEPELPRGSERILLIDDEASILKVNKIRLERLGYHVTTQNISKNALFLFAKQPNAFDLIITDMTMPEQTGEQLAKECLRIRPDIPIILCTGYSDILSETKAREMGIREYVMKPIMVKDLAEAIRKAVEK